MEQKKPTDLGRIKRHYGEDMMRLCRALFPTILEREGVLYKVIDSSFAHSKLLYDDILDNRKIADFQNYIFTYVGIKTDEVPTDKNPYELMKEAGYTLYHCKTEEDVNRFKKYYAKGEALCTFKHVQSRLDLCHVFFAVKDNVDDIKREDFKINFRDDLYGTSVISIQFDKTTKSNTLSIKNRYNHTVVNSDATFGNNLDNIIPGLTHSFEKYFKLNIINNKTPNFEMKDYVKAQDGRLYRYNYERNHIYYCPNNIIIDNNRVVEDYKNEQFILLDYFLLDLKNKIISKYDESIPDSFTDSIKDIEDIKVTVSRKTKEKKIGITTKNSNIIIFVDKFGRITKYMNDNLKYFGDYFLLHNKVLNELVTPNVEYTGNFCFKENTELKELSLPDVKRFGDYFMCSNEKLSRFDVPLDISFGSRFMKNNLYVNELLKVNNSKEYVKTS
jgi:hypothetical protein